MSIQLRSSTRVVRRCGRKPMKMSKARYTLVLLFLSVSTVSLLVSAPDRPASLVVPTRSVAPPESPLFPVHLYSAAAHSLRQENLQDARQHLEQMTARHPAE